MLGLCRYYASSRAAGAAHRILLRSAPPPIFTIAARIRVARGPRARFGAAPARPAGARRRAYDPSALWLCPIFVQSAYLESCTGKRHTAYASDRPRA